MQLVCWHIVICQTSPFPFFPSVVIGIVVAVGVRICVSVGVGIGDIDAGTWQVNHDIDNICK